MAAQSRLPTVYHFQVEYLFAVGIPCPITKGRLANRIWGCTATKRKSVAVAVADLTHCYVFGYNDYSVAKRNN